MKITIDYKEVQYRCFHLINQIARTEERLEKADADFELIELLETKIKLYRNELEFLGRLTGAQVKALQK